LRGVPSQPYHPDLSDPTNCVRWQKVEAAKRRLVYSLINPGLPLPTIASGESEPLIFDFLADPPDQSLESKVMTGHDSGVITVSLAEADDAAREQNRVYITGMRSVITIGTSSCATAAVSRAAAVFGDDSQDYAAALQQHYAQGVRSDWQSSFVSAYASMHPWENFAETFAHYLHIVDTLETANDFGIRVRPKIDNGMLEANVDFDPYQASSIEALIHAWLPLTFAVNSINRSMGQPDLYPFILSPAVIDELGYIDALVHD
jgi:hypothetical protein